MTAPALVLLIVAVLILWGGLAGSIVALRSRPEVDVYPPGGDEADRDDSAIIRHDT